MRLLIFSMFTFLFTALWGQPTITADDMFGADDTARVSETMDMNIDITTTGQNAVWDFSELVANSQRLEKAYPISDGGVILNLQFGPSAPAPYPSDYYRPFDGIPFEDFGNFLPVNIENVNRIVKKEDDSLFYTGLSITADGQQFGFRSDTIETGYHFPLEYGDSYTSRGYTYADFDPLFTGTFIQYRQRYTTVDGHGTLVTPYANFTALRVHHRIEEQDSLYAELQGFGNWIPIERTTHEYEWWVNDEKRPVCKVETEEVNGSENVTAITYRDKYLGLDASLDSENLLESSIYPNPARETFTVSSNSAIETIRIYGLDGREHRQVTIENGAKKHTLNAARLPAGAYNVQLETSNGTTFLKLLVK